MDTLHVWHLIVVFAWGGLVAGEIALELSARDLAGAKMVARAHAWIDLAVELPLLLAILATGAVLAWRAWPMTRLHFIKIALALIAIAINLACVAAVQLRQRAVEPATFARWHQRVKWTAAGLPFGLAAAWIGLAYFTP